jgi:arginine exporter protein ArgO
MHKLVLILIGTPFTLALGVMGVASYQQFHVDPSVSVFQIAQTLGFLFMAFYMFMSDHGKIKGLLQTTKEQKDRQDRIEGMSLALAQLIQFHEARLGKIDGIRTPIDFGHRGR